VNVVLRLLAIAVSFLCLGSVALQSPARGETTVTITEYPIPAPVGIQATPRGIAVGPDGKLWFTDFGSGGVGAVGRVGRMGTDGSITDADVIPLPSAEPGYNICAGPDGAMWVTTGNHVDRVPTNAAVPGDITQYAMGVRGDVIVTGPDGNLWVSESYDPTSALGRITPSGSVQSFMAPRMGLFGLTSGPGNALWFGEDNTIARMSTSGVVGPGDEFPLGGTLGTVRSLVTGPDGNVWFAIGFGPSSIGRITPDGTITTFPTPTENSYPFGIAVGPDGRIWFTEIGGGGTHRIGVIPTTATSGSDIIEYPIPGTNPNPQFLVGGPDGRIWFTEYNKGVLGALSVSDTPTPAVDGFILPRRVLVHPNARNPARSRLLAVGIFDTGSQAVDLSASATLTVAALTEGPTALAPMHGRFVLKQNGLLFAVRPARTGSSKAIFRLKVKRDLTGLVARDGRLDIRFVDPAVDGLGTVLLGGGRYRLGARPGALLAPNLYLARARARLAGAGKDKLSIRVGLATDGTMPASAPDLRIGFGPSFVANVPGSAFAIQGRRFVLRQPTAGLTSAILDYARETLTVRAKRVDLGTFGPGLQPVTVAVGIGADARANRVRMLHTGKRLAY
jgi:streptogramin lyase